MQNSDFISIANNALNKILDVCLGFFVAKIETLKTVYYIFQYKRDISESVFYDSHQSLIAETQSVFLRKLESMFL